MDFLLPLWLRQYLSQRQKREIPEDVADHLLQVCAQALQQRDPVSLAQPRTHSIQRSFALIAQQKSSRPPPSSSSSSSSTSAKPSNRSKFPFTATTSLYRKVTPRDLGSLNSQEIVRVAIYVMKRSHLDFADPFTSEKVHTSGEEYSKQHNQAIQPIVTAAADIYLSRKFNIGKSVLHNPSYPLRRPLESAILIATFCAKASGGLRSKSSLSAPHLPSPSSIAEAKWLAKLGQIIFGGPCSHAGHSHHRRTRASLELLENQNIELGKQILVEEQQQERTKRGDNRPHSISTTSGNTLSGKQSPSDFYPLTSSEILAAQGSEHDNTLSRSTSISTSALSTASNRSTANKWCKHCSRAVACLVLVAQQEASKITGENEYVFDDTGFGAGSAFEHLDIRSATSSVVSSPSTPHFDFRPRLRSKSEERDLSPDASPYIIFDHSHEQHNDGVIPALSSPDQSSNTNLSQQRKSLSLEKSLADAFSSEFATESLGEEKTKPGPFIPRMVNSSNSNSSNGVIVSPSLGSDVELVSRTTSSVSLSSSGQETSHTGASSSGPRPVSAHPLLVSPLFLPSPPKTLLERDLAEAIATDARLPFMGNIANTGRRLSSDLGLHPKPSLDSVRESVSRSNSERSSFSSGQSAGRSPPEAQEVAIEQGTSADDREINQVESYGGIDKNSAHVNNLDLAEDTSEGEKHSCDKDVACTPDNGDNEVSPESKQTTPRPSLASPTSTPRSSSHSRNDVDESRSENLSHQPSSASTHEISPSQSPLITSTPSLQSSDQNDSQATKEPERIHRPFYALGIHGQTPIDAYTIEIEESIQKGNKESPPSVLDEDNQDNSSAPHSPPPETSTVLKEPFVGSDREQFDNEEESCPDQETDEIKASPSLSSDKENTSDSSASPPSPGNLSSGISEDDRGDSLENDDEENDEFDPHSSVSTKTFTSSLRPLSSFSSISTLTDDYPTTGSSEDDANTDHHHSSRLSGPLEGNTPQSLSTLTQEQRRALEQKQRRRHRRQQLVDDAKRKQEQLDRIKAQLELKHLGKIRQQVSFWEEKGVLEQRVVGVEEVEVPDLDDD